MSNIQNEIILENLYDEVWIEYRDKNNLTDDQLYALEQNSDNGIIPEIEEETNFVKVRLGGACSSCAMSAMTLKQGIEKKLFQDFPDCNGVIQVL